ncbi:MAG: transposase [Pseudomonadota bacterium]
MGANPPVTLMKAKPRALHGQAISNYRRLYQPGGTYFFTVRLADGAPHDLRDHIQILRHAFRTECAAHPFEIEEAVILPNHLHNIRRLPEGDADFSNRWRRIKTAVTKAIHPPHFGSRSKFVRGERGFWQRRFWEHLIRDEAEMAHYRAYCWFNPVRHGYVQRAEDWPQSSFHRAVARGDVARGWCWAA